MQMTVYVVQVASKKDRTTRVRLCERTMVHRDLQTLHQGPRTWAKLGEKRSVALVKLDTFTYVTVRV